jgi:hypothetical protein
VLWLVQAQLLYLQITATSKETGLNIVAGKSLEVQLSEPWVQKSLHAQEAGIARVTNPEAVRDRVADIPTESSRLLLVLRLLVSLPLQPPNMSQIAEQTTQSKVEVALALGASQDVVIPMTMTTMMIVAQEAEADMLIQSIVPLKWPKLGLPLPLSLV